MEPQGGLKFEDMKRKSLPCLVVWQVRDVNLAKITEAAPSLPHFKMPKSINEKSLQHAQSSLLRISRQTFFHI